MSASDIQNADAEPVEYVLGLMDPAERKAFERDLLDDPDLAAEVWSWEERFAPMAQALPEHSAPRGSYRRLSASLFGDEERTPARRSTMGRDLAYLFGTIAAAAVAALVVFIQVPGLLGPDRAPTNALFSAAIVENDGSIVLAVVDRTGVIAVQPLTVRPSGSAELWLVTNERDPVSMGLLDAADGARLTVPDDLRPLLSEARFVVTAEPTGGSVPGTAPGPAIAAGPLVEF